MGGAFKRTACLCCQSEYLYATGQSQKRQAPLPYGGLLSYAALQGGYRKPLRGGAAPICGSKGERYPMLPHTW